MKLRLIALATVLSAGLPCAPHATAATMGDQGGSACQLSLPTIDSKVRPRATGMRNEGSSGEFVICQYATIAAAYKSATLYVATIDGANHTVQCTAMRGSMSTSRYSSKNVDTGTATTVVKGVSWFPADFDATSNFGDNRFSVTCNLPPGASIASISGGYDPA